MEEPEDLDPAIRRAVRALAKEDESLAPSADVEARLRAEVRSIAGTRRRRVMQSALGAAAALILAAGIAWWRGASIEPTAPHRASTTRAEREVTTEFLPLPYAGVPAAHGHIVRLEVPRSSLHAFGFGPAEAMRDSSAPPMVLADVFVGEDGLARSVRFVLPPPAGEKRP